MNILNKTITEIKASDHNFTDDELKNIKLMPFVTQGTLTTLIAGSGIAYDFHLPLLNKSYVQMVTDDVDLDNPYNYPHNDL